MNDDPTNNQETKESIERQRHAALAKRTQELLGANEVIVGEFDIDDKGEPVNEARLSVVSPDESTLRRLGYGEIRLSHIPSFVDEGGFASHEITTVAALGPDRETELRMFALLTDEEGQVRVMIESDATELTGINPETRQITHDIGDLVDPDPDTEFGLLPLLQSVTTREELELQSILDACRDHVTFPSAQS